MLCVYCVCDKCVFCFFSCASGVLCVFFIVDVYALLFMLCVMCVCVYVCCVFMYVVCVFLRHVCISVDV